MTLWFGMSRRQDTSHVFTLLPMISPCFHLSSIVMSLSIQLWSKSVTRTSWIGQASYLWFIPLHLGNDKVSLVKIRDRTELLSVWLAICFPPLWSFVCCLQTKSHSPEWQSQEPSRCMWVAEELFSSTICCFWREQGAFPNIFNF